MDKTNLKEIWESVTKDYDNRIVSSANDHNLHLAMFEGEYKWHFHPNSDEMFIVMEGNLLIEFEDGENVSLKPFDVYLVKAKRVHKTSAVGRTVNLCFEKKEAETIFLEEHS
jgi:mannose-6-phosphate isomerase-like protein (cupin superfamily)